MYIADDTPAHNALGETPDNTIEPTLTGHQTKASSRQFQREWPRAR